MISTAIGFQNLTYTGISKVNSYYTSLEYDPIHTLVHIHLDPVVKSVERRCFTLIDVFQRVGGMLGLIQTVG
jgi:hypothetical protein